MSNNNNNPIKEIFDFGGYFYEMKTIKKTRKEKTCRVCGETIPSGSGHLIAVVFIHEFRNLNICNECEKKYKNEIENMKEGLYNED